MTRKGITPVVAVVLLLMMTVAAAGGAYTWVTGIVSQGQEEGQATLNRQVDVKDVSCDLSGNADVFLSNSGSTTVDASSMTYYLYNVSTGSLLTTASSPTFGTMAPGATADLSSGGQGTVAFGQSLNSGYQYRVEIEFTNEDGYTVQGTCQAQ